MPHLKSPRRESEYLLKRHFLTLHSNEKKNHAAKAACFFCSKKKKTCERIFKTRQRPVPILWIVKKAPQYNSKSLHCKHSRQIGRNYSR